MTRRKKLILLWSHYVLLVGGVSVVAYCAFVTIEAKQYQAWAHEQLQKSISPEVLGAPSDSTRFFGHAFSPRGRGIGPVGRLDAPRIQLSAMIAEGTTARVLDLAAGHVRGTALPGQTGNTALAAHRDRQS
jgi:sortase A